MQDIARLIRHIVVGLAATLAIVTPLFFAVAALGTKFGLWEWQFGLSTLTFTWGPRLLMAALALGVIALAMIVIFRVAFGRANAPTAGGWIAAFAAIAIGAGGLWYAAQVGATADELPPIHDISTDRQDPPGFSEALERRRGEESNDLDYASKTIPEAVSGRWPDYAGMAVSEAQAEAYPDIQPIALDAEPERAYEEALAVARDLGWHVGATSPEAMMFEATAETFWFGFLDDVSVRVTPGEGGGALVDVRSVSRVGLSDLGANAARIRTFDDRLRARIG